MSNINIANLSYDSNMDTLAMYAMTGGRSWCSTGKYPNFPWLGRKVTNGTIGMYGRTVYSFSRGLF